MEIMSWATHGGLGVQQLLDDW